MDKLDYQDLKFALLRMPKNLIALMKSEEWHNSIYVGGGFIRSIIAREPINDIDLFVKTEKDAELLAYKLAAKKRDVHKTDNAYTIRGGNLPVQIIKRWLFQEPKAVSDSFDFTVCCAVIFYDGTSWDSYCDKRFYIDLASKRLIYRNPVRNEDAGGSLLRVLKYYQRGYRIPLDSLGAVIARLIKDIDTHEQPIKDEFGTAKIITGLLRVVDPAIDPFHEAHLESADIEV